MPLKYKEIEALAKACGMDVVSLILFLRDANIKISGQLPHEIEYDIKNFQAKLRAEAMLTSVACTRCDFPGLEIYGLEQPNGKEDFIEGFSTICPHCNFRQWYDSI